MLRSAPVPTTLLVSAGRSTWQLLQSGRDRRAAPAPRLQSPVQPFRLRNKATGRYLVADNGFGLDDVITDEAAVAKLLGETTHAVLASETNLDETNKLVPGGLHKSEGSWHHHRLGDW